MTEPKKRGPKPKCKECGRKEGEGHYDDCPVGLGVVETRHPWGDEKLTPFDPNAVHTIPDMHKASAEDEEKLSKAMVSNAQAYALRVWNGQSVDVPRAEKLRRVKLALDGQGLSMDGVVL